MRSFVRACLALLAVGSSSLQAQIYADFTIDDGSGTPQFFTIRLNFENPAYPRRAVANFIGLATGSRQWIDQTTGETMVNTPFYDGLLIHKVVSTLTPPVSQGIFLGSPDGTGTDGPGYVFQDEPNSFPAGGSTVYMDTDAPNSNGSRIFITSNVVQSHDLIPIGFVEDNASRNTIFALSGIQTVGNGKPFNDHTITTVGIRRIGFAAQQFNELDPDWDLPEVGASIPRMVRENGQHLLRFSSTAGNSALYYTTTDFLFWEGPFTAVQEPDDPFLEIDLSPDLAAEPKKFYRGSAVTYPSTPAPDHPLPDAFYITTFTNFLLGPRKYEFSFNAAGDGGTWCRVHPSNPSVCLATGNLTVADFTVESPFTANLFVAGDNGLPNLFFRFHHDRDTVSGQPVSPGHLEGSQWETQIIGGFEFRTTVANSEFIDTAVKNWEYIPAP